MFETNLVWIVVVFVDDIVWWIRKTWVLKRFDMDVGHLLRTLGSSLSIVSRPIVFFC